MAEIYRNPTVEWYISQIGYSSGSSKSSKYSKLLDSVSFYNYKKNGYANWCGIFYDAGIYENAIDASVDEVRAMVYEPNKDNCGAGCAQKIDYYKSHKAWYPHKVKGCPAHLGDEVFFGSSEYKSSSNPLGAYHTGAVIGWNNDGIFTAEGNTNGRGDVSKRFYKYTDSKLLGYGRPDWTADEPEKEKPVETSQPEPESEPIEEMVTVELPILYKGIDSHGEVLTIQALLNGFGLRDDDGNMLAVDGIFGSRTEQAVRKYQESRGLEVCGIVNAETWNRILK